MYHVLVIDDDANLREYLRDVLTYEGLTPTVAESGAKGLQMALDSVPDLVLCDVGMPGVSGYDVLAFMRAEPTLAEVPFVFLTGFAEHDFVRRAMQLGANDYLIKPCRASDLRQVIQVLLKLPHSLLQSSELEVGLPPSAEGDPSLISRTVPAGEFFNVLPPKDLRETYPSEVYPSEVHSSEVHSSEVPLTKPSNYSPTCSETASTARFLDPSVLERELNYALLEGQLQVYYQPRIDARTGRLVGMEALLRWFHPQRGLVSPQEFIPMAEQSDLIYRVGEWVLQEAAQQLVRWQALGHRQLVGAVNLSAEQLKQADLCDRIFQILQRTGLDPQCLELEVTESTFIQDPEAAGKKLRGLHRQGIRLALDDFGTGYASLRYLQSLPFDVLKIDRCFVRGITQHPSNAIITTTTIQMAHNLKLEVVAEGVETATEFYFLQQHRCDVVQGFLFGPPMPASEFEAYLQNTQAAIAAGETWSMLPSDSFSDSTRRQSQR